jgi:D-alanyl-D-alanine carboxypeptidase/D-alanyl-D-alanine-endopeptidase (penicillin-binding protein 4)
VESLRQALLDDTTLPGVRRAAWGIVVHSLDRDERLFELNPGSLLIPASVTKIVSAASAGETVGWDYTYATTLRTSGPVVDGVLTGDLVVTGSGDPSIGGRAGLDLKAFVDAIKAHRIHKIDGRIIGDDDAIEDPRPALSWGWDDLGYVSGALFGALNVYENRMTVSIEAGAQDGAPTTMTVEPHARQRPIINRTVTSTAQPLIWPEQRPGEAALTISGNVRPRSGVSRLSVSAGNPTLWFASVLRERLMREGVEVTGQAADIDDALPVVDQTALTTLTTLRSQPLSAIVVPMLKESINLYGEAVMRLNAAPGRAVNNDAALAGLRLRMDAWGVPPDAQHLIDGSGLSRRDVIAPEALYVLLKRMQDPTGQSPFVAALPVAGVDGSLDDRFKGTRAAGNLRAKTGTMSNVRTLAGYVTTRDGEHLALVIMANNYEGTGQAASLVIDRMAVRLADFTRQP